MSVREAATGVFYRGGAGQWSYFLHRLTGLGVLAFLAIHILDTALVMLGQPVYDKVMTIYRSRFFRVNEVILAACVLYHALNGVRVFLVDYIDMPSANQKRLFKAAMILFWGLMIPAGYWMLRGVLW